MLKSYFLIAWRKILKDRQFSLLNLVGLSIGLAGTLLIYLWINDELRMDRNFGQDDQLFQVMKNSREEGDLIQTYTWTPGPLAKALVAEMPEVQYGVTVASEAAAGIGFENGVVTVQEKQIRANEQYASEDYFKVFSYPLLQGDRESVLKDKFAVVVSDEMARKLFNTDNVVGQKLTWKKKSIFGVTFQQNYSISGVFKKPENYSSANVDLVFALGSYSTIAPGFDDWSNSYPDTYVLLRKGADAAQFNAKLAKYLQHKTNDSTQSLFVRKYSDRYLYGKYDNGVQAGGRIAYVRLFSIVAIFILVIACVNFMNLSTAKASGRMKEIGVKKAMGARRGSLIVQFMIESVIMALLALILAAIIIGLSLSTFEKIIGKQLSIPSDPGFMATVLGITLFTGIVSGSYPALYLSGFNPLSVLKGKLLQSAGELWVRKGLVVFQFVISAILIVSVLVVYRQMKFVNSTNLGFNKDNIIVFKKEGAAGGDMGAFLREIKNIPGVTNAANFGSDLIVNYTGTELSWPGKDAYSKIQFKYLLAGYHFIETLDIKLKEGRPFMGNSNADSSAIIFNEAAIKAMGLENPVGKDVVLWDKKMTIVGVVKNFHFESLYEKMKPCFLVLSPDADKVMVKIASGSEKQTISGLQAFNQTYNAGFPFEFSFLDQDFEALYRSENRVATLAWYFAGITIIISCLGLFGLAAFTAQKRQKEISIRKVVGASTGNLIFLLVKDFLQLILIAIIIAFPLAWWATSHWLGDFAYRASIGANIYLLSAGLMLLITLLTISYQAIRSAFVNPVKSLRAE